MFADAALPKPSLHLLTKDKPNGPVTRAHLLRSRLVHIAMCLIGALPWFLEASTSLQAAGWGLWLPGAGFIAVGGWAVLLFPLTLVFFGLAFFAWFGSGMIIAPIIVWAGSAVVAGVIAGSSTAAYAPQAVPAVTIGWLLLTAAGRWQRHRKERVRRDQRNAYLPTEIANISRIAVTAPPLNERALSADQLGMLRYAVDRALQPIGSLNGFDMIEQFQASAVRYQLNHLGYVLSVAQRHYTPNFHGYLSEGQRRVVEQSLQRQVWGYWRWESAWGHLSTEFDPCKKDNIMLTGFININALHYMNTTDDMRYGKQGSMSFVFDEKRRYAHDVHSINGSIMDNYRGQVYSQPYCLFPCEPNWIYTYCNFRGVNSVSLYDTLFGTHYFDEIRDNFRRRLEEEFINIDGSLVALRSKITGHALPFPLEDATLAKMLTSSYPDLAARYWAIARREILTGDKKKRLELSGKGFDFGNYKAGHLLKIDSILGAAREFGDEEAAEAALDALKQYAGRVERDGVVHFDGSNLANLMVIDSHIGIAGGMRELMLTRPAASVLQGPILTEASYPDVLVARAVSDGDDLNLVLHPGRAPGSEQSLTVERLKPGRRYRLEGATVQEAIADTRGHIGLTVRLSGPTSVRIQALQ